MSVSPGRQVSQSITHHHRKNGRRDERKKKKYNKPLYFTVRPKYPRNTSSIKSSESQGVETVCCSSVTVKTTTVSVYHKPQNKTTTRQKDEDHAYHPRTASHSPGQPQTPSPFPTARSRRCRCSALIPSRLGPRLERGEGGGWLFYSQQQGTTINMKSTAAIRRPRREW